MQALQADFFACCWNRNASRWIRWNWATERYIQHEEADAYEPGYQLKGIQTVTLQPKETKRVTISLKARDFAIITQEGECVVRPGSYRIAIGGQQPDARSAKLTGSDVAALVVRREGAQTPVEY